MSISSQQLMADRVFILRGHKAGGVYGDPFDWACVATFEASHVKMMALVSQDAFNVAYYREVVDWAAQHGATKIIWERYKNGKIIDVEFDVKSMDSSGR